jgi:glutamine synthetase
MSVQRFSAIENGRKRTALPIEEKGRRSTQFASKVFGDLNMQQYLTLDALNAVRDAVFSGTKIHRKIADQVAEGMKTWAIENGATHYTHWFQPLTGSTAEKHEAFLDVQENGQAIEVFGGNQLVQQESDASSLPSGGIRNTFEARGYTAWDPSSPAFIYGNTLCIPTIYVSFTGMALDNKAPLLRALHELDAAATEVALYFDKSVSKVNATLGWEQEYFLVDKELYHSRIDLSLTGRTLVGQSSAKGQQLDDHYFGVIPARVLSFMSELEKECILLGIPVKTRHNEVAPNQFEIAPQHEEANLSVDHNLLLMDLMDKIADKHLFKVLFHEKPFEGINGSGKHNNWSLKTDTGVNLLSPGTTPTKNLQFLTFFINTIKAVNEHEAILRASISSQSNDLRMGSQEAPPFIFSIFIGAQLSAVLDELEGVSTGKLSPQEKTELKLNVVGKIPEILTDNTDQNRTSPFAFTGNKFEIRGVGSKANCAKPMTVLNTIVAHQLKLFKKEVDTLIDKKGLKKDEAIFNVLREYIKTSKRIRFEGDGYTQDWIKEAKKRKLSSFDNTVDALSVFGDKSVLNLFDKMKVLNPVEMQARTDVDLDIYVKQIQLEARILGEMVYTQIIPASVNYLNQLSQLVVQLKAVHGSSFKKDSSASLELIEAISNRMNVLKSKTDAMVQTRKKVNSIIDNKEKAIAYRDRVLSVFQEIREQADKLELLVSDEFWPLTKYRELLFVK